jgi:hypothetical protein
MKQPKHVACFLGEARPDGVVVRVKAQPFGAARLLVQQKDLILDEENQKAWLRADRVEEGENQRVYVSVPGVLIKNNRVNPRLWLDSSLLQTAS